VAEVLQLGGDEDFLHPAAAVSFGWRRPNHGRQRPIFGGGGRILDGGGHRRSGWRPELGIEAGAVAPSRGREEEERGRRENGLQVGPRGRWVSARLRVRAVCLVDPNVNNIYGGNGSSADRFVCWGSPAGSSFTLFFPCGHVRTAGGRMCSPAGDALRQGTRKRKSKDAMAEAEMVLA
jgi:hypothetical protein